MTGDVKLACHVKSLGLKGKFGSHVKCVFCEKEGRGKIGHKTDALET